MFVDLSVDQKYGNSEVFVQILKLVPTWGLSLEQWYVVPDTSRLNKKMSQKDAKLPRHSTSNPITNLYRSRAQRKNHSRAWPSEVTKRPFHGRVSNRASKITWDE